jgi:flagellar hook-associated protein 3 FlgL
MTVSAATAGSQWFLNGVANIQQELTTTERQLSSGYQIQDASDSPAQTPALVQLGSQLATVQNYQTNLTRVQAEASGADQAIGSAISLIENAQTLGAEGADSTATAATRQTLAGQIQGIQQQVVGLANTNVAGRYIFGGSVDQSPPYQVDTASASGVDSLTTSNGSEQVVNPAGQLVYQPLTAQQIFAPVDSTGAAATGNTFVALQSLETALTNNDQAGIASALTSLRSASVYVNQQQAYYGTAEKGLTSEQNNAANQTTALQVQISGIRDTNVAQAASNLTEEQTAQTAAYSAEAEISTKSLFSYLG